MIKDKKYYRKPRRTFGASITEPNQCLNIRTIIDRLAQGKPVNTEMRQHVPLPPDGMIEDDFETGTEEITDITDAVALQDDINARIAEQNRQAEEQRERGESVVDVTGAVTGAVS